MSYTVKSGANCFLLGLEVLLVGCEPRVTDAALQSNVGL
ncbi:hypothetical protein PhaeoP70_02725 [Phaeobacter inhibens]|nr:hypothetical protein PhaeoP92_02726 [Phaeobacter inhibens]AUQ65526.1 hypothetical protein PhaeoP78_00634 [Phaeobacter inhibens]AUQ79392.1 hypothetical protein PhaeoP74_02727 [Phaeobacter inhibens]AUR16551.1 hypothetical protein PhaeoP70_02725 [Phaeobacter inhibens]